MTRKRRVRRRRRRTQKGGKPTNPESCKGLPYLINGLTYNVKTSEYYKGETTHEKLQSFLEATCKPLYVVSTKHESAYTLKKSYLLVKNHEQLDQLMQKWLKMIEPISKEMFSSSLVGIRSNINPFKPFYEQLQLYKTTLDNKKGMLAKLSTSDTEVMFTDENIKDTLLSIQSKYNYYNDIPFNMKEFLGFEKIGGWMGSESTRKQTMQTIDDEVKKLATVNPDKDTGIERVKKEYELKKNASKALVVLASYVYCYLNYLPIPLSGQLSDETTNQIIEVLNTFYGQINQFSAGKDAKAKDMTPEKARLLLEEFEKNFDTNLGQLKKAMNPGMKGGGGEKPKPKVVEKIPIGTRPKEVIAKGLRRFANHISPRGSGQPPPLEEIPAGVAGLKNGKKGIKGEPSTGQLPATRPNNGGLGGNINGVIGSDETDAAGNTRLDSRKTRVGEEGVGQKNLEALIATKAKNVAAEQEREKKLQKSMEDTAKRKAQAEQKKKQAQQETEAKEAKDEGLNIQEYQEFKKTVKETAEAKEKSGVKEAEATKEVDSDIAKEKAKLALQAKLENSMGVTGQKPEEYQREDGSQVFTFNPENFANAKVTLETSQEAFVKGPTDALGGLVVANKNKLLALTQARLKDIQKKLDTNSTNTVLLNQQTETIKDQTAITEEFKKWKKS